MGLRGGSRLWTRGGSCWAGPSTLAKACAPSPSHPPLLLTLYALVECVPLFAFLSRSVA